VQIIVVDRRFASAKTFSLTRSKLALTLGALGIAVVLAVIGLYAVTFRAAAQIKIPLVKDLVSFVMRDEVARNEQFVRDNVSALARRMGEMQAQLMRLDALGERVSKLAGIRPEEFNFRELPGRGGAEPAASRSMSLEELQNEMERIATGVANRQDYMDIIESELMTAQVRRTLLPQNAPVVEGFVGSVFGMRADPFTGQMAMHAGLDFAAPAGTPIYAAAGGVVASAETHAAYGKTVEIRHGNDLSTVYAHASKLLVKPGDIVRRGQIIAEVGTTGRSTGPHVHFEVHHKGVAQNPSRFLFAQKKNSPLAGLAAKSAQATAHNAAPKARKAALVTTEEPAKPATLESLASPPASEPAAASLPTGTTDSN